MDYASAQKIALDVMTRFDAGEFDVATLFFNKFQSVISQIPTAKQLIPANFDDVAAESEEDEARDEEDEADEEEEDKVTDNTATRKTSRIFYASLG